ncbi:MAG TPA: gentisate 1,2-dioxygenase [Caulobacteraceae bacterium]|jgi:gentisate 1,2-dioxygenase|nr:gentisate 1,2-dioxygenase [Caulobacteraceae bacterium]
MSVPEKADSALAEFSREIGGLDMMPLWERPRGAMTPGTGCAPHIWRYSALRPHLVRATELISKRDAERRVLVLENPRLRGTTYALNTLYAGLQAIQPGEIAPSHRHTPNALRFVIEGEGAYTSVGGERATMHPGDFVVTPNWSWHDHGNVGEDMVVWLDGLDTPFGKFFGAMFREDYPDEVHPVEREDGESLASYGANMAPADYVAEGAESPILLYPYDRTREALDRLYRTGRLDPAHGIKLRYVNPTNGRHPFRTIAAFMQFVPKGFAGRRYRSTEGTIYVVHEGRGAIEIAGERYSFAPHDVFVVPPWQIYSFAAEDDVVLFSYSDRAAQQALGFWREERVADR